MKTTRFIVAVVAVLTALTVSGVKTFAQGADQEKKVTGDKLKKVIEVEVQKAEMFTVLGAKFGFETKLVSGAPYSAIAVSETVQTLGDGNRIRQTSSTTIYRDSAGRTRREVTVKTPNGMEQAIVISDPAGGMNYTLDPQNRTAIRRDSTVMKKVAMVGEEEAKRATEEKMKLLTTQTASASMPPKKRRPVAEPLGRQVIEGVEAEGSRTTTIIPAGQIGNDLPINIVSEQWYSPELQLLIMTKHSDPRTGETTYRLTNINRAEPDRSMFEVPGDYTVRSEAEEKMKLIEIEKKMPAKRKPEDQQ